jgi:hypothetical protein
VRQEGAGSPLGAIKANAAYIKGLAGRLATYALSARPKGSSDEEPAGAPGARFLPLAFSSLVMRPRR